MDFHDYSYLRAPKYFIIIINYSHQVRPFHHYEGTEGPSIPPWGGHVVITLIIINTLLLLLSLTTHIRSGLCAAIRAQNALPSLQLVVMLETGTRPCVALLAHSSRAAVPLRSDAMSTARRKKFIRFLVIEIFRFKYFQKNVVNEMSTASKKSWLDF